ncbi:hypothetical protein ABMA28_001558 [Loxostege sticticalis]|uniref:Serine carboxypeptidase n=1 Tax=Loxostege sticticalis TaxID=481309 RepID=A0ABD0T231_LOXSC
MNVIFMLTALLGLVGADVFYEEYNPYTEALSDHPWKSEQKYVEVRPGAFMFYWLYYADGTSSGADRKPLIIWVQGGPGLAASGIANFMEIGPLNINMQPRNHTWVKGRNVLLIDHPVGTGFSYVTDKSLLVKSDRMMATDLSKTIKAFFRTHKEFRKTPTYLFSQSYGGKLCPRLAYYLHTAIEKKRLKMNFKGIGIGSGFVSPKESVLAIPDFLYNMGAIDQHTFLKCNVAALKVAEFVDQRNYTAALQWDSILQKTVFDESGMTLNFNNINQVDFETMVRNLDNKINNYVKPTLNIVSQRIDYKHMSDEVFENMRPSMFVPSTKFLEILLNKTELNIAVYNGNLDIITPLAGASNWVHNLKWHGAEEFKTAERIKINGYRTGFYKKARRFSFWWVFGSGHWVPEDNPVAMEQILEHVMASEE